MSSEDLVRDIDPGPDPYPPIFKVDKKTGIMENQNHNAPFMRIIQKRTDVLLEWHNMSARLRAWKWPTFASGLPVPPHKLVEHQKTHLFKFPSCFCARGSAHPVAICEVSIFIMPKEKNGFYNEIVAQCQTKGCNYFVNVQRTYSKGLYFNPKVYFKPRTIGELSAPAICEFALNSDRELPSSPLPSLSSSATSSQSLSIVSPKRTEPSRATTRVIKRRSNNSIAPEGSRHTEKRLKIEETDDTTILGPYKTMNKAPISFVPLSSPVPDSDIDSFTLLLALDSSGVTLKDFKRLLVSCNKCKDWIGTESAFKAHYCCKCYPTYVELEDGVLDVLSD